MVSVLKLPLPYEAFLKEGEKYLTNEERVCAQNLMIAIEDNAEECVLCMQRFKEIYGGTQSVNLSSDILPCFIRSISPSPHICYKRSLPDMNRANNKSFY